MNSVAFYISGHGFGHASRQVEIINAFARQHPDAAIFVRSSVAPWLLQHAIRAPFELDSRPCDTGVIQIDSLHLDAQATIERAADFYSTFDARAEEEAAELRARQVDFVVSDAPPLACEAAYRAAIPSVVVANFTWDWIYQAYPEHLPAAPGLIETIQRAYTRAAAAWRLPLHGGFESFETIVDIPFVARHSKQARETTRTRLGLPNDMRLALPSFGGYSVDGLDLERLELPVDWTVVRGLRDATVYEAGLNYEDLVHAVDLVISKPGYGIVSECLANGAALVYTSRGRFAEYAVFVREMPRFLRCAYIDNESLLAGRWSAAIEQAINSPAPLERPRLDGAELVADMIAECLPGGSSSPPPPSR